MPQVMTTSDGMTFITSKLDGDTLTVHPLVYSRMQCVIARADGDPYSVSAEALRIAGLTDDEIARREYRATRIVVDETIARHIQK